MKIENKIYKSNYFILIEDFNNIGLKNYSINDDYITINDINIDEKKVLEIISEIEKIEPSIQERQQEIIDYLLVKSLEG